MQFPREVAGARAPCNPRPALLQDWVEPLAPGGTLAGRGFRVLSKTEHLDRGAGDVLAIAPLWRYHIRKRGPLNIHFRAADFVSAVG